MDPALPQFLSDEMMMNLGKLFTDYVFIEYGCFSKYIDGAAKNYHIKFFLRIGRCNLNLRSAAMLAAQTTGN